MLSHVDKFHGCGAALKVTESVTKQRKAKHALPEVIGSARAACRRLVVGQRIWAMSGEVGEMAVAAAAVSILM